MAIYWNEVKRNEKPDFRSTVESRLRTSGVLDALYLARVKNTEFYYGKTSRRSETTLGPDNEGEESIRSNA